MEIPIENFFPTIEILGRLSDMLHWLTYYHNFKPVYIKIFIKNLKLTLHGYFQFRWKLQDDNGDDFICFEIPMKIEAWESSWRLRPESQEDLSRSFKTDRAQFSRSLAFLTSNKTSISSFQSVLTRSIQGEYFFWVYFSHIVWRYQKKAFTQFGVCLSFL